VIGSKQSEGTTTIGRGASLRGDLRTTGDIVIEGNLEGSLHAEGARVTVGREANVHADVFAQEVIVEGRLMGALRATERVELRSSAAVEGSIFARRVSIEENAVVRGKVDPTGGVETHAVEQRMPTPVVAPVAPAPVPAAEAATPTPAGSLFSQRPAGHVPAGLAAAARNLGAQHPAGLNALRDEGNGDGKSE